MIHTIKNLSRNSLEYLLVAMARHNPTSTAIEQCLAGERLISTDDLGKRIKLEIDDAYGQLCKRVTEASRNEYAPVWFYEFSQAMTPFLVRIDTCIKNGGPKHIWNLLLKLARHAIYAGDINRLQGSERDNDYFHDQLCERMRYLLKQLSFTKKHTFQKRKKALEGLILGMKLRDEEFADIIEIKEIDFETKEEEQEYRAELTERYYAHRYWQTLEYLDGIEREVGDQIQKAADSLPRRRPTYCQYHDRIEVTSRACSDAYYEWRRTCWREM